MNPEITDQTLVLQRLKEGDEKTFELLFHRYYAALCFFANKILKDEEAARDVVQEVFIRFYEKSYDFPNLIALKSFLYSTPKYEEATYFRHQIEAEIFEEIFAAIEELPSECRRIFKMSYLEHMDIREITEKLQIAESTVKTQRQRAKQYLRKRLKNLYTLVIFLFFE